ncbi:MAG: LLM class F420-dependent oxidoreductase [Actinomycetota bacterium]|nr:LLM class F420-dependent oxidoreductase [Actinomycetota bacterium]
MRIGIHCGYTGGFTDIAAEVTELESLGLDSVVVAEGYSFDAVSQLGYLAALTSRATLVSGILPIYTRTPSLTAMTAAGLDFVSDGRFMLGLGTSGPQVIEGFHGVAYDSPLQRTREVVEICRQVWRREPVVHDGSAYTLPLPPDQGRGLGKPLKLINTPIRADIPVSIAAIGPKNVALAAEIAQAWHPIFFLPDRAHEIWSQPLAAGTSRRDEGLGPLRIVTSVPVAIAEHPETLIDAARPNLALYIGGMGARGRNFYNELACRYGFAEQAARIQELYLAGRKREAAAAVPDELVRRTTLIGPRGYVAERLAAFADAGVTTIFAQPIDHSRAGRRSAVQSLIELAS